MTLLLFLLHTLGGEASAERRFKALKFGQTENDYVLFQSDMGPFRTGFTVCSWIRKLYTTYYPTWFSYATSEQSHEIQIGDDGYETRIFGDESDLRSLYTVSPGTWFHNCMSWDTSSQRRDVYLDGVLIDSKATPAGRTLGQGGYLLLGNEQSGLGSGMDNYDIFGGEMYKLNVFSRKLSDSEIKRMSRNKCSCEEVTFSEERMIKWEDILLKTRTGTVTEIDSGCSALSCLGLTFQEIQQRLAELNKTTEVLRQTEQSLNETLTELEEVKKQKEVLTTDLGNKELQLNGTLLELEQAEEEVESLRATLENTEEELNSTRVEIVKFEEKQQSLVEEKERISLQLNSTEEEKQEKIEELEMKKEELNNITTTLNQTKVELDQVKDLLEKAANSTVKCALNSTVTSYWDLLYSEDFFGGVITAEKIGVLRKSMEKLGTYCFIRISFNAFIFRYNVNIAPQKLATFYHFL